ncbi:MAG TPA: heavy-metal-associated domain-containing protein [Chitinophagaceae bacterium]|nr:heavy-metal-associated domain-containing protein [Chitinophagaceae bacterium]
MKRLSLVVFFITFILSAKSQVTAQKPVWATISVPQMKCWVCKERLEDYLTKETGASGDGGILQVKINMYNGSVRIQYSPDRFTLDYLRTAIANAGYDADTVKANEDSYKMLPPICKRKDDGGGPQKGQPPCTIPPDQR